MRGRQKNPALTFQMVNKPPHHWQKYIPNISIGSESFPEELASLQPVLVSAWSREQARNVSQPDEKTTCPPQDAARTRNP